MAINVTIQQGDNLPLARLLNSGGVAPRLINIEWETEPTSVEDPRPGLFPFISQGEGGYEVLISPDETCQQGVTYEGILRGTVTDNNGNFLIRDLPVSVTIEEDVGLVASWQDLERIFTVEYETVFDFSEAAGEDGWVDPGSNNYGPITPITSPISEPTVVADIYYSLQGEDNSIRLTFASYGDPVDWSYISSPDPNITVTLLDETGASNSVTYVLEFQVLTPADFTWYENLITVTATDGVQNTELTLNFATVAFAD